jgi:hypothetical protein
MIAGGGVDGVAKQKLLDIIKFVFEKRLLILCAPNDVRVQYVSCFVCAVLSAFNLLSFSMAQILSLSHIYITFVSH